MNKVDLVDAGGAGAASRSGSRRLNARAERLPIRPRGGRQRGPLRDRRGDVPRARAEPLRAPPRRRHRELRLPQPPRAPAGRLRARARGGCPADMLRAKGIVRFAGATGGASSTSPAGGTSSPGCAWTTWPRARRSSSAAGWRGTGRASRPRWPPPRASPPRARRSMAESPRRPRVAITMGDAAGIGPEIIVKTLAAGRVTEVCVPVVLGDARVLRARHGRRARADSHPPARERRRGRGAAGDARPPRLRRRRHGGAPLGRGARVARRRRRPLHAGGGAARARPRRRCDRVRAAQQVRHAPRRLRLRGAHGDPGRAHADAARDDAPPRDGPHDAVHQPHGAPGGLRPRARRPHPRAPRPGRRRAPRPRDRAAAHRGGRPQSARGRGGRVRGRGATGDRAGDRRRARARASTRSARSRATRSS